jgi:hypothetical protein
MAGTFGVGTPYSQFAQTSPWGFSPNAPQGLSINPFALQQLYGQPFGNLSPTISPANPYGAQPLQPVVQLLQLVPQQLQQLESMQLQQLQLLQQLVQVVPTQLAQLQQLIQFAARQIQQPTQLQQPFGQIPGLGSSIAQPWGIHAQVSGTQPGQVM